jgi:hypothetical protein
VRPRFTDATLCNILEQTQTSVTISEGFVEVNESPHQIISIQLN